jgi:hypothetical protein
MAVKKSYIADDHILDIAGRLITVPDTFAGSYTGIANPDNVQLSFSDSTPDRTLTVTPDTSFTYFIQGVRYTKTDVETYQIPTAEGHHYIYYDGDSLASTQNLTSALWSDYAVVSAIHWDNTNLKHIRFANEKHSHFWNWKLRQYLHEAYQTRWGRGLALENIISDGNGSLNTHAQCSVSSGAIWDEDIRHYIEHNNPQSLNLPAQIPGYYRSGASGVWLKHDATDYPCIPFVGGAGRLAYNEYTGATWQQTEISLNQFVLSHIFATNDVEEPIIFIQGQNDYLNLTNAQIGADNEIYNLQLNGFVATEYVALGTLIFQTSQNYNNDINARIVATTEGFDYVDWRRAKYL